MRRFRDWVLSNWGSLFTYACLAYITVTLWRIPAPAPVVPPPQPTKVVILPPEPLFDYGPRLSDPARPTRCEPALHKIGDTPYTASLGVAYYENAPERTPAYYRIEINYIPPSPEPATPDALPTPPEIIHVMFSRDFRMDELPGGFLVKSPEEIVSYDADTRLVTFHIGEKRVTYRLPLNPAAFFTHPLDVKDAK